MIKKIVIITLLLITSVYAQVVPVSVRCISKGSVLASASDRDIDLFSVYLNNKNRHGVEMLLREGRVFSVPIGSDIFVDTRELFYNYHKFNNIPIYVMPDVQIRLFMDREFLNNLKCQ